MSRVARGSDDDADAPARLGSAVATAVAAVAGLGAGVALGTPVATVAIVLGGLSLAVGGRYVVDDDPRRRVGGSTAIVGGSVLAAAAPWLAVRPSTTVVAALFASGLAAFAAASDAAGRFAGDDVRLSSGATGSLYALVPVAVGAAATGLTHAFGLDWLAIPYAAAMAGVRVVASAHLAAATGLALVVAAAVAWLGNALLARVPRSVLARPPFGVREATLDRLDDLRDALGRVRAKLLLAALFGSSLTAVLSVGVPQVAPAGLLAALGTVHQVAWTGVAGLFVAWVAVTLWRVADRWAPTDVVGRLATAGGGAVAVAAAVVATSAPVYGLLTAGLPPELVTGFEGAAADVGGAALVLVGVAASLVAALAVWTLLVLVSVTPLLPERAGGFALAASLLFGVGLLAGVGGAGSLATFGLVAAALFVWDVGDHAAELGARVGDATTGSQVQLVHVAAGGLVAGGAVLTGLGASAVAPLVGGLASPGAAVVAVALLLSAALLLMVGLWTRTSEPAAESRTERASNAGTDSEADADAPPESSRSRVTDADAAD